MDASAANKLMIFLLFSLSILLIVNGAGTSFKQVDTKPKHEHSQRKLLDSTAVFNPVTTIPGGTNPVTTTIPPPSIVTIPSPANNNPATVYNPVTTNPAGQVVPGMTNYPPPLPPAAVAGQSWCVAKGGATETALQAALDYACGIGGADCSALQVGASCYYPNTLENHASFAFNSYYQRNPVQTSCDFGGTALITNVNPSSGSCIYSPSTTIPQSPAATTGVAPPITTNPTTTPTPTTTGVSPITTNPTTGVSPITTNPTPTPTADSGIIPISFGTPPMVSSGANPALGGGTTGYGDGSSFPGNNSSSSPLASTSSNLAPFMGSIIFVVTITITTRRVVFDI